MKPLLKLLLIIALSSCTNIEGTQSPAVVISTKPIPTSTLLAVSPLPSTHPPTFTPAMEDSCDPLRADFCITDGHFILQRPIQPPANDRVDPTYRYGSTANGTRDPHHGVEFVNASGTPVYAAVEGMIVFAGPDEEATYSPWPNYYGNLVVIEHDHGLFTLYAHLSHVDVQTGQRVLAGDKVGEVGRTGVAIGSHLHFEVRRGSVEHHFGTQNPELWLMPAKDANGELLGTLLISVVDPNHVLVKYAEFTIQYYPDRSQPAVKSYYGSTYAAEMLHGEENAVLSELPAGPYRIAVEMNGQIHERWVEVKSGKLTQVVFVIE